MLSIAIKKPSSEAWLGTVKGTVYEQYVDYLAQHGFHKEDAATWVHASATIHSVLNNLPAYTAYATSLDSKAGIRGNLCLDLSDVVKASHNDLGISVAAALEGLKYSPSMGSNLSYQILSAQAVQQAMTIEAFSQCPYVHRWLARTALRLKAMSTSPQGADVLTQYGQDYQGNYVLSELVWYLDYLEEQEVAEAKEQEATKVREAVHVEAQERKSRASLEQSEAWQEVDSAVAQGLTDAGVAVSKEDSTETASTEVSTEHTAAPEHEVAEPRPRIQVSSDNEDNVGGQVLVRQAHVGTGSNISGDKVVEDDKPSSSAKRYNPFK